MRPRLVLLPLVLLAGCGGSTIDQDDVRSGIAEDFRAQGIDLRDVACDEVDADVGSPVKCTARNPAGSTLRLEGKVYEEGEDGGRFRVTAVGGTAKGTLVARDVKRSVEEKAGTTVQGVTCPEEVDFPATWPVTCALSTRDGEVYDVAVTSAGGKFDFQVAEEPRR